VSGRCDDDSFITIDYTSISLLLSTYQHVVDLDKKTTVTGLLAKNARKHGKTASFDSSVSARTDAKQQYQAWCGQLGFLVVDIFCYMARETMRNRHSARCRCVEDSDLWLAPSVCA